MNKKLHGSKILISCFSEIEKLMIQKLAFKIGYRWNMDNGERYRYLSDAYAGYYVLSDGFISHAEYDEYPELEYMEEISINDLINTIIGDSDITQFTPVVIESPFRGINGEYDQENISYLNMCILDCLLRGEAPFASHVMYTDSLNDYYDEQRYFGIKAGFVWRKFAEKTIFYIDRGFSLGMVKALEHCKENNLNFEIRTL